MNNDELLVAIKDMFENKTDEIKYYVDEKVNGQSVLIESLRSDIKAVAEGHEILQSKIEDAKAELSQSINKIERRIDNVDKNLSIVKDYVICVDSKLNEHEIILKRVK